MSGRRCLLHAEGYHWIQPHRFHIRGPTATVGDWQVVVIYIQRQILLPTPPHLWQVYYPCFSRSMIPIFSMALEDGMKSIPGNDEKGRELNGHFSLFLPNGTMYQGIIMPETSPDSLRSPFFLSFFRRAFNGQTSWLRCCLTVHKWWVLGGRDVVNLQAVQLPESNPNLIHTYLGATSLDLVNMLRNEPGIH